MTMNEQAFKTKLNILLSKKKSQLPGFLLENPGLHLSSVWSKMNPGIYLGGIHNGLPQGFGSFNSADGSKYVGEWYEGKKTGLGRQESADGVYIGYWHNDSPDGKGCFECLHGNYYEGEWKKGKRNGFGAQIWSDGSSYFGEWYLNFRKGQGTYLFNNGSSFEGQWSCDLPFTGTLTLKNGPNKNILEHRTEEYPYFFSCCYNSWNKDVLEHGGSFEYAEIDAFVFSDLDIGSLYIRTVCGLCLTIIHYYTDSPPLFLLFEDELLLELSDEYYLEPDKKPAFGNKSGRLEPFDPGFLTEVLKANEPETSGIIKSLESYTFQVWEGGGDLATILFGTDLYHLQSIKGLPFEGYSVSHPKYGDIYFDIAKDGRVVGFDYISRILQDTTDEAIDDLFEEDEPDPCNAEMIDTIELLYEKELTRIKEYHHRNKRASDTAVVIDPGLSEINGGSYSGGFLPKHRKAAGYGTFYVANKTLYEGGWVAGYRNGIGRQVDETTSYIGWWDTGKYHGAGILRESNDIYIGEFKNGYRNGMGTQVYANGDSYTGEWMRGFKKGQGVYRTSYGLRIEAMWSGDLPLNGSMHRKGLPEVLINDFSGVKCPYIYIPCYSQYYDTMHGDTWFNRNAVINSIVFTDITMGVVRLMSKAPVILYRSVKSWPPAIHYGTADDHIEMINNVYLDGRRPQWSNKNGSWGKIEKHKLIALIPSSEIHQNRIKYALSKLDKGIWKSAEDYCVWPFPKDSYKKMSPTAYSEHIILNNDIVEGDIRIDYLIENWGRKRIRITKIEFEAPRYNALMLGDEDEVEWEDGDDFYDSFLNLLE